MTLDEILDLLQSGENISPVTRYISDHPGLVETLMSIALTDGSKPSWRAAWMVDKIHEQHPELIVPYLPPMIDFVMKTNDSGKKRHLLKLISLYPVPEANMARLLNFCIGIFTNTTEDVAVRVHAMQILFNIAEKELDFSEELIELIEQEMEIHGSAGIASRGRKLIQKLNASIKNRRRM